MEIIGFSGKKRSGKDTAAAVLVEEFEFIRIGFADKLRGFVYAQDAYVQAFGKRRDHELEYRRASELVDEYGWEGIKESPYDKDFRRLMERTGTEAAREILWDSIWIDAAFADVDDKARVVIPDVRFPNEANAIKGRGGVIIRIERPAVLRGTGPAHYSDKALDDYNFDLVISNNHEGNLEHFRDYIRAVACGWGL